ncbi:MAG: HNH endonuclease [Ruminococcus sp.]|nr:HNH endonuclease [Ruminococcus sp.]
MTELNDVEKEIVEELLILMKNNQYTITYKELCERLFKRTNIKLNPHYGLPNRLGQIGKLCNDLKLPEINTMVINAKTKLPGYGLKELKLQLGEEVEQKSLKELFDEEQNYIKDCPNWQCLADYLQISIVMPARGEIIYPQDIDEINSYEGAKKRIVVNSYERNAFERKRCIDHYSKNGRISCQICGFDFGEFYGENYRNLIEVHHIKPISEIGKSYKIDGTKDLIPLCPNCHMVVHSKNAESIDDLKERISNR